MSNTIGKRKPCCEIEENLEIIEDKPHVQVKRCKICKCRHFRALLGEQLEPGQVKITP